MYFNLASLWLRLFGVLRFLSCVLGTSQECFLAHNPPAVAFYGALIIREHGTYA